MDWIAKLLSSLFSGGIGLFQGLTNYNSVQDTNAMNLKIARETNQSNVEQANLAYARSLPFNQVNNLMDAGMSRAAALNKLSGGGTYTAPTLSSARMDAPQMNLQGVMSAIERLGDLPSNVTQQEINKQQLEALRIDNENKIAEEKRKQELHAFNMWKFKYDKNTAEMLDTASQKVLNSLIDSGKSIEDFKDFEDMIHQLGLTKDEDIRNLNYVARQDLETAVRTKFDSERARQKQENENEDSRDKHQAALDAHELHNIRVQMEKINLAWFPREKYRQFINLLRVGEGLLEENNIKFQDRTAKELDNYLKQAGIDNERDAKELYSFIQRLLREDEFDMLRKRFANNKTTGGVWNQFRLLLRDLGEILSHVTK